MSIELIQMKKIYPVVKETVILFYSSCYRPENTNYVNTQPVYDVVSITASNPGKGNFTVNLNDSAATQITVYVSLMTNDPANDLVSCSLSGAPAGITISLDSNATKLPATIYGKITAACDTGFYATSLYR